MEAKSIAIAGATGNLGGPILNVLLHANFFVVVLSRVGGNSSKLAPHPNLNIKEVDFHSSQSMVPALYGVDVVVSCLATSAMGSQNPLIDAAEAAGVKRFIPAEFGMDSLNPLSAQMPIVCAPKAATQKYLLEKHRANKNFTYTAIANGLFLDWGLEVGLIVNPAKHTATLYNGGTVPFSVTNRADIAKAVLGVINNQDQTANRLVYIHSAVTTQNKLIQYAKEKDGKEWVTSHKDTKELWQESMAELEKGMDGDIDTATEGLCICGTMDPDYGGDFSNRLDNDLLGIETLYEDDIRVLVGGYLKE